MADRTFKADLTGSDETLEHLLARLRSTLRRPAHPRRDGPWESFVTSRRPRGGAGGAEAPIPNDKPAADAYAPI
jgi:hypothetical protein